MQLPTDVLERADHLVHGGQAIRRRGLETAKDDSRERARLIPPHHFLQDGAKREDVGARVDPFTTHLLGRHVPRRPSPWRGVRDQSRQAEVENLYAVVGGEENVLRLEVAMHDATCVCSRQPPGHLQCSVQRAVDEQSPAPQSRPQRLTFEALGDDVGCAMVIADVVDRQDVGMIESPGRPRFPFECLGALRSVGCMRQQELDGDARTSRWSRARHTSPMPPAPRRAVIV